MNYELCIMNCRDASFLESEKNLELQILRFSDSQILSLKKISGFQIFRFSDLKKFHPLLSVVC